VLRATKIVLRMRKTSVLFAVFAACAFPAQPQTHVADAPAMREFVDETGRTIRVPQTIQRVVSLAPSLTETIYALGLQDRLVGDTDFCDYPAEAQKITKVGGAVNPSIEKIASLHPDLVLVTKGPNRLETVETLKGLGIPSYATDPHTVDGIIFSTEKIAEVMGAAEAGKSVAEDMEKHLGALQEQLKGIAPRRVLFVVWTEPLISIGKDTFIADALRRAGAVSIVDSAQSWSEISLEEMARLQPEYLVFAASHSESVTHDVDVLMERPGWRLLDAVRNRRFAVISDAVNRPAPRIVSAIEELARQLHPEVFLPKPDNQKVEKRDNAAIFKKFEQFSFSRKSESSQKELACVL
jgi:iron complex transport system substrate-binding protein